MEEMLGLNPSGQLSITYHRDAGSLLPFPIGMRLEKRKNKSKKTGGQDKNNNNNNCFISEG